MRERKKSSKPSFGDPQSSVGWNSSSQELKFISSTRATDESKTHIFLSPFFKYISGLKVQFNVKPWSFHLDLCFVGN